VLLPAVLKPCDKTDVLGKALQAVSNPFAGDVPRRLERRIDEAGRYVIVGFPALRHDFSAGPNVLGSTERPPTKKERKLEGEHGFKFREIPFNALVVV